MSGRHRWLHHSPVGYHLERGQLPCGVFTACASRHREALVDTRLFMPEPWWSAGYATRHITCQVPKALTLQTKPQLAVARLCLLDGEDVLPFTYVVPDCLQGKSPAFLAAAVSYVARTFGMAIPVDTRCWI